VVRRDGDTWRRVVSSPEPVELLELPLILALLDAGALVVCAGGGGIPVIADASGMLHGVEAVVDEDLTAALLARAVDADALLLLTDVDAVIDGFGTPGARPIHHATPGELRVRSFPAGSMGPKVDATCRLVEATGRMAAIGSLDEAPGSATRACSVCARVGVPSAQNRRAITHSRAPGMLSAWIRIAHADHEQDH
jgi:carbamate kinase